MTSLPAPAFTVIALGGAEAMRGPTMVPASRLAPFAPEGHRVDPRRAGDDQRIGSAATSASVNVAMVPVADGEDGGARLVDA